jgi:hypothetical protein
MKKLPTEHCQLNTFFTTFALQNTDYNVRKTSICKTAFR